MSTDSLIDLPAALAEMQQDFVVEAGFQFIAVERVAAILARHTRPYPTPDQYDTGYEDGENSVSADFSLLLSELPGIEAVERDSPSETIKALHADWLRMRGVSSEMRLQGAPPEASQVNEIASKRPSDSAPPIQSAGQPVEMPEAEQSRIFNLAVDLGDRLFGFIKADPDCLISWDRYGVSKEIEKAMEKIVLPYLRHPEAG